MKMKMLCGMLFGTLALACVAMGDITVPVTFSVDMGVQIAATNFNPATMGVEVRGGFNGWSGGSTLVREGTTTVYSATFSVTGAEGGAVEYKFFGLPDPGGLGWESIGNRSFNLGPAGATQVLATVYFNDQGSGITVPVTFSVDMGVQIAATNFNPATMGVEVRGGFNGWSGGSTLVREGTTTVYSATFSVTGAEGGAVEYKFFGLPDPGGLGWESIGNRSFNLGPAGATQVLATVYFNDQGLAVSSLTFTSGTWDPSALGDYPFELTRTGEVGDEIVLTSSNTNSVTVPLGTNFITGSNTVSFNATVASLTAGDATITASNAASGLVATYIVRPVAPSLSISGDAIQISGGEKSYTLTRSASTGTNILFFSSDEAVMTVAGNIQFSPDVYSGPFPATFLAFGSATITATDTVSGAWTTFAVTYQAPKLTLIGLRRSWAGGVESYRVTREGAVGDTVNIVSSNTNVMTSAQASVTFAVGENTAYFNASSVGAGATAWTASNDDATSDALSVTVEAAPDFAAYDDASLYAGGVWSLTPAHASGFPDWTETLSAERTDSHRGSFIGTALIPGVNVAGVAFGLFANYSGATPDPLPEVKLSRDFPAAMATGQTFSVDVGYNWNSGTKGFKLKGSFEGADYDRFELFNSGNDTWSYKLDGNDATITPVWSGYVPGGFVGRVQATCTAPNTFTFSFLREGAAAPTLVENVVLPGGIDQVEFYDYNGGSGDNENFFFNRMWLTTAPGEGPGPGIESAVYDSATDKLTLALPGGYSLTKVEGADCALTGQAFVWSNLVESTDYTVEGGNVILETTAPMPSRRIVRFGIAPSDP